MKEDKLVRCPICNSDRAKSLLNLNCGNLGNLDDSALYRSVKINACEKCGHVYNRLSLDEITDLIKYYNEEYAPTNIGSTDKTGDRPGSNNQNTLGRYDQLYDLISKHINSNSKVLDIGCAMGGFLDYLHAKSIKNLSGIDPTKEYVNHAKRKGHYDIKLGSAESIPFNNNSFDLLVMDQVLEHIVEPRKAFQEAKRVLVDGGLFCIGIPDASRYDKTYFFDFFWFLMREHIQHFDIEHLKLLAEQEGFELIDFSKSETPMMSEKMLLPNLNVIFCLTGEMNRLNINEDCFKLKKEIEKYVANDFKRLDKKRKIIDDLVVSQKPLYVWGIGREFLYLYESAGLKNCNVVGLIDINPYKQNNFMLDGKKIMDQAILNKATPNSILIITAIAHTAQIEKTLQGIDYSGEVLKFE